MLLKDFLHTCKAVYLLQPIAMMQTSLVKYAAADMNGFCLTYLLLELSSAKFQVQISQTEDQVETPS